MSHPLEDTLLSTSSCIPICAKVPEPADGLGAQVRHLHGGATVGCLTHVGRKQGVALGLRLRGLYVGRGKLLERYSERHVFVRTTNYVRTRESARMVVTGLFGSGLEEVKVWTVPSEACRNRSLASLHTRARTLVYTICTNQRMKKRYCIPTGTPRCRWASYFKQPSGMLTALHPHHITGP